MSDREKTDFRTSDRWLVFAFTLGPLAALSNLVVAYALVPTACEHGAKTLLHATTVAFLIVALAGALIGRHYQRKCNEPDAFLPVERSRWLAIVAIVLSIASAIIIVAMEVPNVLLRSCD
jgi:uncharacterized membrane protein